MAVHVGKDCKVTLGSATVVGIGNWTMSGPSVEELEDTEFGDEYKEYEMGMKDWGTITFAGNYHKSDTTGQTVLQSAWAADTDITDIRLYVDNTSYWIPLTTAPTSRVNITSFNISADKSGLVTVSFTGRVSGAMELL